MSLNLSLSTALSGLMTNQTQLSVLSDNIVNVNTVGYTRKTLNQSSVVLAGSGAGVQAGTTIREVDEGLLKQIRAETSTMGQINSDQNYYPQIENLFGQVGDGTSIADTLQSMASSFSALSSNVTSAAQQSSTVSSVSDVTTQLNTMTTSLQALRIQADQQLSADVTQVNADVQNIYTLNQSIVRNTAIGTSTADLADQRDQSLTNLSKLLNIQYYQRNDGSMVVYTASGVPLLDSTADTMTHAAVSVTQAWMTQAGGQFNPITLDNTVMDGKIGSGEMASLINMRDNVIPNMQSQVDEMSKQLQNTLNQISNRSTSFPNTVTSYTGTRVFATQGNITPMSSAAGTITYNQGVNTITSTASGTFDITYSPTNGQITMAASGGGSLAALTAGTSFTLSGTGADDGTYTVTSIDSSSSTVTVSQTNPIQTISIGSTGGGDVAIGLFDTSGNQLTSTTLNTVMTTDYSGSSGSFPSDPQATAQASNGPWSIDALSKHLESWLRAQGPSYAGATVGLNSDGHFAINMGSTVQASLVFRDQASSTAGSAQQDAAINFDVNGDGQTDQTVQGFSNFLGLNDLLVTNQPQSVLDSNVLNTNFTTGTAARTLTLYDGSGQLGNTVTIPANSTLQAIAAQINSATQINQSQLQASSTINLNTSATISVGNAQGAIVATTVGPGAVTLNGIASALNVSSVNASVVQDGTGYRLRLSDSQGNPLTVTITGGTVTNGNGSTLGSVLGMTQTNPVSAEVVPDGSGQRLRIVQAGAQQIYAAAGQDAYGKSILTDLGLSYAAAGTAQNLTVRGDIVGNASNLGIGTMQWNADNSQYYLSPGDNSSVLAMANAMTNPVQMATAGQISAGQYTFSASASQTISLVATASANSKSQQTYQSTLSDSLNSQYTSTSGVNLDQEVSNLVTYQQAYQASAKVISVIQAMMGTMTDMLH